MNIKSQDLKLTKFLQANPNFMSFLRESIYQNFFVIPCHECVIYWSLLVGNLHNFNDIVKYHCIPLYTIHVYNVKYSKVSQFFKIPGTEILLKIHTAIKT